MIEPNHIFVYGTLKRSYCNAHFLENECEFVANATVPYKMFAYVRVGVLPQGKRIISAPMLSRESGVCHGEVWRLPAKPLVREDLLRRLDWLEGVDFGGYTREIIEVHGRENNKLVFEGPAFVYFHNAPQGEVFENWAEGESK